MVAALRAKTSDRAAILKKLLPAIKKQYKIAIPKHDLPVLETMLFAVCLEDSTVEEAEKSYARLFAEFPDLNEVRVSSISEIERAFVGQIDAEWKAYRTRCILQYVFEKSYAFELEGIKKKTLELATKQLSKIKSLTPFVRNFTLQSAIGAHLIPIDTSIGRALVWLGLVPPSQDVDQMGETMKAVVRKAEVQQFIYSIRCLATDAVVRDQFDPAQFPVPPEGFDGEDVTTRLTELYKAGTSRQRAKTAAAKAAQKEAEAKIEAKAAAKAAKAAAASKTTPPVKKAVAKHSAPTPTKVPKKTK